MEWQIEKGVRCDLLCYAAKNLTGKSSPVRIFPQGNRKGDVRSAELRSMVIRAPYGTRVILITEPGPDWQDHPWRCIRMREGRSLKAQGVGLPGVRLPDLNLLDVHGAKRTDPDLESTYPAAATLQEGDGWTFGRIGSIQASVQLIRVEKDRVAATTALSEPDKLARSVITRLGTTAVDAVAESLQAVLVDAGHTDALARVRDLRQWAAQQD